MNKLLLSTLATFFIALQFATAQTEKNKAYLGISSNLGGTGSTLSFNTLKNKSDDFESDPLKSNSFNLAGRAGMFLEDNFVLGVDLIFNTGKLSSDFFDNNFTQIAAGPFARYYFKSNRILPFVEANINFGSSKNKSNLSDPGFGDDDVDKSNTMSYGAGAGAAFFIGNNISFDALLGYARGSSKDSEDNPNNFRTITSGVSLRLGFSIYLGGSQREDLSED